MKYELEKTRMNYNKAWIETIIKTSPSLTEIETLAESITIRFGKTFEEKLNINHVDEYGDIVHVESVKCFFYDRDNGLKPTLLE